MTPRFQIVDVFAERRYAGNPLAVVESDAFETETMQAIALEMGFSETTFLGKRAPDGAWPVRIFTPRRELPFAGHPTLGSAAVIRVREAGGTADSVTLRLGIGDVPVVFDADGVVWMAPPEPEMSDVVSPDGVTSALGVDVDDLDTAYPLRPIGTGIGFLFVPLRSLDAVRRAQLTAAGARELGSRGLPTAVFAFARQADDPANHIHARMFAPLDGVPEDPATGSANTCLAAYIREHDYLPGFTGTVRVEQGIEMGRPSLLRLNLRPEIRVGGRVQRVAVGELVD